MKNRTAMLLYALSAMLLCAFSAMMAAATLPAMAADQYYPISVERNLSKAVDKTGNIW